MKSHPLILELQKLKESSRYAIAQGGKYDLNSFKKYLHVEREVENRLKQIIVESSKLQHSQLILVCGNVGDGKSHILSFLHNEIPSEIAKFHIHNDATESHNPNESSDDTLCRVLNDYNDNNIEKSSSKTILAINLGTLSKFLEKHGVNFKRLSEYVQKQQILDNGVVSQESFDYKSHFHQINFTDYHLYSLTEIGPKSNTLSQLLSRIVTSAPSNTIYDAYEKIKDDPAFARCPVKYNFEFLFNTERRELIIQLIIRSIAENKEIVSVRSLLNFIHDLVVPVQLSSLSEEEQMNKIGSLSDSEFISCQLPNYIFEHADLSNIFSRLADFDPCNSRNVETDEMLLKLQSIESPQVFFDKYITRELYEVVFQNIKIEKIEIDLLSKYFLRLHFFQNNLDDINGSIDFNQYIIWLYHFNKGTPAYLSKLYDLVENAVKKWFGDPKKGDKVVLKLGRRQIKYRIFKDLILSAKPIIPNGSSELVLHQFVQEFMVCYQSPNLSSPDLKITIDFSLFKTLKMISQGYRPNKKDNNNFIYFVYFINEITQSNIQSNLYIDIVNVGKPIDYKLTKNAFGAYKFELVP